MAGRYGKRFFLRLAAILAAGAACIAAAAWYRRSLRPTQAPEEVQREGREIVMDVLEGVGATAFGQSERGRLLSETIGRLVAQRSVVFTTKIEAQALYRREADGYEMLYVRVLRLSGRYVHRPPEWIAEAVYHEAVHARTPRDATSIEEECDGFAAGLAAGAAIEGRELPDVLTIEGRPVAEFVLGNYPDAPRNRAYQPVGESRAWLLARTGLRPPADD